MISVNIASIAVAAYVLAIQVTAYKMETRHNSPIQKRDTSKLDINALRTALEGMDSDLVGKQKRTCAIGINSHHCALASMDDRMLSREWLNNGYSPGKRAENVDPEAHSQAERELEEISLKRDAIATLKHLLLKMKENELQQSRKRSCKLRLGGACLTEALDHAASQYYYLRSAHSPGKRRKRDLLSRLVKS